MLIERDANHKYTIDGFGLRDEFCTSLRKIEAALADLRHSLHDLTEAESASIWTLVAQGMLPNIKHDAMAADQVGLAVSMAVRNQRRTHGEPIQKSES